MRIERQDHKHGKVIPPGCNPTLIGWYVVDVDGARIDGPFDYASDARDALECLEEVCRYDNSQFGVGA